MKETGIVNRDLAHVLSKQGHGDMLLVADAGFAIPEGVETIDLSLSENQPMVLDVLNEFKKFFSVEKLILAEETQQVNPTHFNKVSRAFGQDIEVETIPHAQLKELSYKVKAIVRTGDFTANGNIILVSGAGSRWYLENP
ncbi:MAG: D-ribose pyranase [Bacteroidales bacterium]|nr:D-ribose pyranase [Bacteroidales bacterium]MBS3775118.1 D-ribose pyranase [Bacteroidales bacterium]